MVVVFPPEVTLQHAEPPSLTLTPIAVTLVGQLDDVLVDAFADVLHNLATFGPRPLVVDMSDLIALKGDAAERIAALLSRLNDAGIEVSVEVGTSGWRRLLSDAGVASHAPDPALRASARRRFIIARSGEHAA